MGGFPSHRYHPALALSIRFQNVAESRDGGERTRIQLCGRLSVEVDSAQLADRLRGKQVPLLLAYLVLNRARHVGRDELIVALWPEEMPRSQDAALRTLLSRLRAGLGSGSLLGRDELRLALPEPIWIDVEAARFEMERALRALEGADVRSAWALAQVPLNIASRGLLPGSQADWLEPHRRELEDIRLQALEVIGRAGLSLGGTQLASVKRAADGLIETEPYRESGYVLLMEALAAQGNVAEALRAFERLRSLLRDELGTTPSPETLAVHARLLRSGVRGRAGSDAARKDIDLTYPMRVAVSVELPAELRAGAAAPLIGRKQELEELERVWETVLKDRPPDPGEPGAARRILLLAGEAGIGKTRLMAELARIAHDRGALVLAGRSPEESVVPYQPFLEALRHYVLNVPFTQLRASAREYGSELARLVPELRRRAPELRPPPAGEPETERYRLFEAVVGLLAEISASSPVLLVLDDLHWADKPTLMLLRHLARGFDTAHLLIVGAYRVTEATGDGFGDALSDLRRARAITQVAIGGLSQSETAELIALQTGEAPSPEFSRALHEETEGNPLFVEEIVRHIREVRPDAAASEFDDPDVLDEVGLPQTVKDVIARRLARLDPRANEWLRVAAVIGRDFDALLLERVASMAEDEFLNALDEALAAGLVVETPGRPGRYSFSHALIRETLYEGMSAPRRARIHRRVGEALEAADGRGSGRAGRAGGGRAYLIPLAYHFTQAAGPQDADKAITYAMRAGEQATAMLAHEQAVDQYEGALEVLRRFAPEADASRCELLLALGEAQVRAGDRARAWEAFREAATAAETLGDSAGLARAAVGAARPYIQEPGVVDTELIALLERADEMTREERTLVRVQLLARLCGALYYSSERERMAELAFEAGEIARELDDPKALANACAARRRALWDAAHLSERLETSTEMLTLARRVGDTELELQAHAWLVVDLLEYGDRDAVDAQIEAFTAGAEKLRQPLYVWHAMVWRSMRASLAGHLEEAEELAGTALAAGARAEAGIAPQYYAIQLLAIRREQQRMSELEEAARGMVARNPRLPAWRAALATLMLESGHTSEARSEFELLAAAGFEQIPRDGDWMIAITLLSDVCVGLGDAWRAARLYDLLLPYAGANVVIGLAAVCLGSAARILGKLAGTMGSESQAAAHFERALVANEQLTAPVELAHTQLDYAQLLGRGALSSKLIAEAARAGERLSLPSVMRRAADLQ